MFIRYQNKLMNIYVTLNFIFFKKILISYILYNTSEYPIILNNLLVCNHFNLIIFLCNF